MLPCSGSKQDRNFIGEQGVRIADSLPSDLAQELRDARAQVRSRAAVDETTLVRAWERYDGSLYGSGREALGDLLQAGAHVAILSGGYGVVLATELIGMYEAVLHPSWWPQRVLPRVLLAYAQRHAINSVRAFAAATRSYARVLRRVPWRETGIDDALLLTPEPVAGGLLKSPAAIGDALAALRDGTLSADWRSSYGLAVNVRG